VVGLDGGGVTTESDRTVICGSGTAPVETAPEVDGGFAFVFDVGFVFGGLGLGFGVGVVGAVAV
jgi:hypothetical protein